MIRSFFGDYRFLSNFWLVNIEYEGLTYPTVEHAYQASKTDDRQLREKIRDSKSPGAAKRLGRTIHITENWHRRRFPIMIILVRQKFLQNKSLGKALFDTKNERLIEGNNWGDEYWGVCSGRGQNNLGKILMNIREELKGS